MKFLLFIALFALVFAKDCGLNYKGCSSGCCSIYGYCGTSSAYCGTGKSQCACDCAHKGPCMKSSSASCTKYTTTSDLNIRTGPSTSYSRVKTVSYGTTLCVVSISNGWAKLDSGYYCSASYLKSVAPVPTPSCTTMYSTASLNIRTGPSTSYSKVKTISINTAVCVVSTSNGWSKLNDGYYCSASYLSKSKVNDNPVPPTPPPAPLSNDYIGALVKRFESGSKGSTSCSSCGNDWGMSFGSYQLTWRWGNALDFFKKYYGTKYASQLSKMYVNSNKDFASKSWPGYDYSSNPQDLKTIWLQEANYDPKGFFANEHAHIQANYYQPLLNKLKNIYNPNKANRAMQDCMWSWAVHRGYGGAYNEFTSAMANAGISNPQTADKTKVFDACYAKRYSTFSYARYKVGKGVDSEVDTLRPYLNTAPLPY